MWELTLLQKSIIAIVIFLLIIFYLRRFWFYFWKVNKLLTQFDEVKEITQSTNENVKQIREKLEVIEKGLSEKK